jgi:hypothetical protein
MAAFAKPPARHGSTGLGPRRQTLRGQSWDVVWSPHHWTNVPEVAPFLAAFEDSLRAAAQPVVDGLFGSFEDWERLQLHPEVRCLARLDPRYVRAQVRRLNEELKKALRDVQGRAPRPAGDPRGQRRDDAQRDQAQLIADAIFGPVARALRGVAAASSR